MLVRNRTCVYDLNYHLVFVTKYRKVIFIGKNKYDYMKWLLKTICRRHNIKIQDYEVMPDHVHMLITIQPKLAISSVVKSIKGFTARNWFKKYPQTRKLLYRGHLWSPSYFVSSLGNMSKSTVKQYIRNQYLNSKYINPKWGGDSSRSLIDR